MSVLLSYHTLETAVVSGAVLAASAWAWRRWGPKRTQAAAAACGSAAQPGGCHSGGNGCGGCGSSASPDAPRVHTVRMMRNPR